MKMSIPEWIAAAILVGSIGILIFIIAKQARAEHNHDHHRFHAFYQDWINKAGAGCCNDRDCSTIADSNVKDIGGSTHVRIEASWCPVLTKHYLSKGNSPNWDSAHVCVQPKGESDLSPCERLLCFQPRPLS